MFTYSNITKSSTVGADKMRYVLNFGIASVFKWSLIDLLKKSEIFVEIFDKGLTEQTQNCETDILIRYYNDIWKHG